jgi:dihydrofolate synthase/folylpolyglutamate synthase
MEVVDGDPPLLLDAAHNPAGAEALAEALPAVAAGRPVIACLAVLADKDVAGVVGALAPVVAGVVATEIPPRRLEQAGRPGARALPASRLADLAREAGIGWVEEGAEPAAAVARARSVAHAQGGVALITGSHYLLRYAPTSVE